MISVLVHIE